MMIFNKKWGKKAEKFIWKVKIQEDMKIKWIKKSKIQV